MQNWDLELMAKTSLIFNNYLLLQQDTYLLQTFLKQMPVKICLQNNLATITDTNKNWPEKCFLIHQIFRVWGFFIQWWKLLKCSPSKGALVLLPAPNEEHRSKALWRGCFQVQTRISDNSVSQAGTWDPGPCSAMFAPGQISPRATKYKETIRD